VLAAHSGGATQEAVDAAFEMMLENILTVFNGLPPINVVPT
jgi:phosphoglycerate dehydrogenase-like enzyme